MSISLETLVWIACFGLLAAALGATGVKTLQEFSRRQLDIYCRHRRNTKLFNEIVRDHDEVSLGAEFLQATGTVVAVGASMPLLLRIGPASTLQLSNLVAGLSMVLVVLLACTSWIPWATARVFSAPFLYNTWHLWRAFQAAALPVELGSTLLSSFVARLAGKPDPDDEDEEEAFEEELRAIVSHGIGEGVIEEDAMEMIEGVMDLDETDVGDVMTPRSMVDALDIDTPWEEVVQFVTQVRRTRIPVYESDFDNVIGVLFVKDLLAELAKAQDQPRADLRGLLREVRKVVKSMPLDEMLQEFLSHRSHLAIVQGEYGNVEGVVTIEDVLEEIVGEIEDEKDVEEPEIQIVDAETLHALGITHVADLNEALGITLPEEEDYDTIGGYLTRRLGRVPQRDDFIVTDGIRITVLDASGKSVQRVSLHREDGNGRQRIAARQDHRP